MDAKADAQIRAGGPMLEDVMGLLPVFISTTLAAEIDPRRLRAMARRFIRAHAVLRLEHELLPGGARCHEARNAGPVLELARRGEGVMVCSIHFGPYLYVGAELLASGLDVGLVATTGAIGLGEERLRGVIQAHGRNVQPLLVERPSVARRIIRRLREGGLVLLYADGQQGLRGFSSSRSHRTSGEFLSMPIRMWTGPAVLAQRAGSHVVLAAVWRERWGKRVVEFSDPMRPTADAGPDAAPSFTRDMYAWFERRVRRRPEQWYGWGFPHLFLAETGAAPTASIEALERERTRIAALLAAPSARSTLRAEPTRIGFLGEGDRCSLIEGPTRRVLQVDPLTVTVVRAAFKGVPLGRLARQVNADIPTLSDIVARLTLAGLARLDGPGEPNASGSTPPPDRPAALPVEVR